MEKQLKYRNIKIEVDGIKFDSKAEYTRFKELELFERLGEISNIERQVKFDLQPSFKDGISFIIGVIKLLWRI
jgi:hypothetical protein